MRQFRGFADIDDYAFGIGVGGESGDFFVGVEFRPWRLGAVALLLWLLGEGTKVRVGLAWKRLVGCCVQRALEEALCVGVTEVGVKDGY